MKKLEDIDYLKKIKNKNINFENLPKELLNSKEFILDAVKNDFLILDYIDDSLKNDKNFWLKIEPNILLNYYFHNLLNDNLNIKNILQEIDKNIENGCNYLKKLFNNDNDNKILFLTEYGNFKNKNIIFYLKKYNNQSELLKNIKNIDFQNNNYLNNFLNSNLTDVDNIKLIESIKNDGLGLPFKIAYDENKITLIIDQIKNEFKDKITLKEFLLNNGVPTEFDNYNLNTLINVFAKNLPINKNDIENLQDIDAVINSIQGFIEIQNDNNLNELKEPSNDIRYFLDRLNPKFFLNKDFVIKALDEIELFQKEPEFILDYIPKFILLSKDTFVMVASCNLKYFGANPQRVFDLNEFLDKFLNKIFKDKKDNKYIEYKNILLKDKEFLSTVKEFEINHNKNLNISNKNEENIEPKRYKPEI